MNEQEFLQKWHQEYPMYQAWGELVTSRLCLKLENAGYDLNSHLKQPVTPRLKESNSLIDKAFYRPNKNYNDPYNDIEDKIGCRFVVLLVDHIEEISELIRNQDDWAIKKCRHFNEERKKDPLLFTYQSVHYVVRPRVDIKLNDITIRKNTPCEIQIRTLLQHAYAELTHDALYKAKKIVNPEVHRTVAKSMALIETTDDFFSDVHNKLNTGAIDTLDINHGLREIYIKHTGTKPAPVQKSSLVILDEFECLIDNETLKKIDLLMDKYNFISQVIKDKTPDYPFYNQSVVVFVYWLIYRKKNRLLENWPLDRKIIETLATDISISLDK
ncbi:GTP pyrophosphokinase [Aliivibrio fischeri]|uniref:GTP pyrophosphokinase n=1 Tax=Aliivibrio fischeri TaxID=668 RepID=UPI0012D89D66|nr:(p)ppGpp synthetase [Aliivibrio fischeri]MUK26217.1 (p)ppGpp synthetase [Aliivibrio fischeri]MUK33818.1 (p)ppGpp synthetase [Aliivibrio fischeri]